MDTATILTKLIFYGPFTFKFYNYRLLCTLDKRNKQLRQQYKIEVYKLLLKLDDQWLPFVTSTKKN
jgi:hypothetical protein